MHPRLLTAAIPCLCLLLSTCGLPPDARDAGGQTISAKRESIDATITPTGSLVPTTQSRLNFRVNGFFAGYQVAIGDHVSAGQELARVDAPDQDAAVVLAEADLANAQGALKIVQAKLDAELAQGRAEDIASKQAGLDATQARLQLMQNGSRAEDIGQAQATLDQARAKLLALQNGPRPQQVAIYRTQLEQARNLLLSAQLTRDATCGLGKGSACDGANAQVNAAQNGVDLANQQMALNMAPPTTTDLTQAQAAVTFAQRAMDKLRAPYIDQEIQQQRDAVIQAQQAVQLAQRPYLPTDLKQAQGTVEQAEATVQQATSRLQTAKQNRGYKSLVAPYDGVILAETANPGETVGPNGVSPLASATAPTNNSSAFGDAAVLMASDQGVRINANVDETEIDRVQVGQRVDITFDAFPDKKFTGKVTFVPAQGSTVQNVQQYTVFISVDQGTDVLKPGMTANCAILVSTKEDALVVPTAAVQNVDGRSVVLLRESDGATRQREVQTGLINPSTTEIMSGLQQGDTVVLRRVGPGPAPAGAAK